MPEVDMSNPVLRDLFPKWLALHGRRLARIRAELPALAAGARAAEAKGRGRPLAVVFDIDEVLLCNVHLSGYAAPAGAQGPAPVDFHAADFFSDPATGRTWGRTDPCNPPLPGALALLRAVAALGLKVFFVTGRLERLREETIANFVRVGVSEAAALQEGDLRRRGAGEVLSLCPDGADPGPGGSIRPFKEGRRKVIERTHRIVLNVGDQVSDLGLYGDHQWLLPHPFYTTP